ncbi:SDR family oxidoreductase, partial [Chloroflexota bacterium]
HIVWCSFPTPETVIGVVSCNQMWRDVNGKTDVKIKRDTKEVGTQEVRINLFSMGITRTPKLLGSGWLIPEMELMAAARHPLGRLAESGDVVDAIAFLASERAVFISG